MNNLYDEFLKDVIQHLVHRWMDPQVGIVAAGIFDWTHPPVITTSKQYEEGKWLHAERNASLQFEKKFGKPSQKAVVIVTLSPCVKPSLKSRVGLPCSNLLMKRGLTRVHAGVIDPVQFTHGIREYADVGIHLTTTQDKYCKTICEKLLGIFQSYGDRVNYDIVSIKKEIGNKIFCAT